MSPTLIKHHDLNRNDLRSIIGPKVKNSKVRLLKANVLWYLVPPKGYYLDLLWKIIFSHISIMIYVV